MADEEGEGSRGAARWWISHAGDLNDLKIGGSEGFLLGNQP